MTLEAYVQGFGCIPNPTPYREARAVVVPIPIDWGQSEQPGVGLGPMAILGASRFIETFEPEVGIDPLDAGVATLDAISLTYLSEEGPLAAARERIEPVHRDGKFPLCLGGERTLVLAATEAAAAAQEPEPVGVVLLSRRPALLDQSAGRRLSPRTVGRRLAERWPLLLVGARTWSTEEADFLEGQGAPKLVTAREVERGRSLDQALIDSLPRRVHLSIDVGVLDPAFLKMVGNLEPGGVSWFRLSDWIDQVFERLEVVSVDISGFAPTFGDVAASVVVSQIALRCLARALTRSEVR